MPKDKFIKYLIKEYGEKNIVIAYDYIEENLENFNSQWNDRELIDLLLEGDDMKFKITEENLSKIISEVVSHIQGM